MNAYIIGYFFSNSNHLEIIILPCLQNDKDVYLFLYYGYLLTFWWEKD